MIMSRIVSRLAGAFLVASALGAAQAQSAPGVWPAKPVRVIVPFPAGGQLDVVARLIAQKVSPALGQPVIVDVRPGADGNIGTEAGARAAADGYTWLAVSPPTTIQPSVRPKSLRYDPLRDFEPVVFLGTSPFLFAVPASSPVSTLREFIAHAKAQQGKLSYAGSARGTVVHLATELFMHEQSLKMTMVNYAGQPAAVLDLIGGRVDFMTVGIVLAEGHLKSGKLKALAILDEQRHPRLSEVPHVVELGMPELVMLSWFGIAMPAQTPAPIVAQVNAEINRVLQMPDVQAQFNSLGVQVAKPNSPQDFARFMRDDLARWKRVVSAASIETD
jgi:tripartite-type tricarboxylate transporter receptor subunit TctC